MESNNPREIVHAYLDAIEGGDFDRARGYLSDEQFVYRSPIFNYDSADEFIIDIARVGAILERIERRRSFADGDEVCDVLRFVTSWSKPTSTDVVHWSKVKDGKITLIEAIFDARGYREMFEH
ncbi:MAG: nuclear transport factor 2 family protein [Pseudomonadota bacterium]|nr:MAG: nuclear transport factor 2 family protein [Pseudomonadota bacterium]